MKQRSPVTFSVVIPNYNHARYLPEALDSVLSQSCQPEAVHVIDDASTDNSLEVIRSYTRRHPRMHLVKKEKNCGVNATLNEFLPQLQTTHFFSLAADDYFLPGYFEQVQALVSKYPDAGICLSDAIDLLPNATRKTSRLKLSDEAAYFSPSQTVVDARGLVMGGQCLMQVEGLKRMGGFPESLRWHADHFVCWVLAARHGLCYLPTPGWVSRKSESSYCAAGAKGASQLKVQTDTVDFLHLPEFADVKPLLRDAHALAIFDTGLLATLRKNQEGRYFLTPSFMAMLGRRRLRHITRHPIPTPVKAWFRNQAGKK